MTLTTDFTKTNPTRGNLNNRSNSMFNWNETFEYDPLDRLTAFTNPQGVKETQNYDNKGRITQNNLGKYNYSKPSKLYQNTSVELSPEALGYYNNREGIFNDSMEDQKGWTKQPLNPQCLSYRKIELRNTCLSINTNTLTVAPFVSFVHSDQLIPINNATDTQYTFSGWVYTNNPTAQLTLFIYKEGETGYYTQFKSVSTTVKDQWVYISETFLVPANIKNLNLRLDCIGVGIALFDDVKIVKTTDATAIRQLKIDYNAFKSPVTIEETGVDKYSFTYNDNNDRSSMYYGNLVADKNERPFAKFYSADGTMEIKQNKLTGTVEFLTYIGGDAYTAPIVLKSDGTTQEFLYLHRDYQGSILAVSNSAGNVVEKRLFDAWGNVVKVQDGNGLPVADGSWLIDRGYTGHEHLHSIGIIHMNGRLYDPKLHRFLQPDNYVQDPTNTQNYNRYGYVMNNPLRYTDPSGELVEIAGATIIAAVIGGAIMVGSFFRSPEVQGWMANAASNVGKAYESVGNFFKDAGRFIKNVTAIDKHLVNFFKSQGSSLQQEVQPAPQQEGSSWTGGGNAQTSGGSYYGGDGSGSFNDYFRRFVYETDQWNPIALVWDGIEAKITGTDRYNNELSGFESSMKIVSAIPITKTAGVLSNVGSKAINNLALRKAGTVAAKKGWKLGEPITNLTAKGNVPAWSTVRQRFWKNEALTGTYSETNLLRMQKGLAPQFRNPTTGLMESMELHHTIPQRNGGLFEFIKVTPDQHRLIDPFRR
jgi:RHS repeat-associated protein